MGSGSSASPSTYEEEKLPDGVFEIRLSVYYLPLLSGVFGAYHSGLVVDGSEWAYGGHDEAGITGVYQNVPERHPDFKFYKRVILGRVSITKAEMHKKIQELVNSPDWEGPQYRLYEHNCHHFSSDLSWSLLRKRIPDWVTATPDGIARNERKTRTIKQALDRALEGHSLTLTECTQSQSVFFSTYKKEFIETFEGCWIRLWAEAERSFARSDDSVDPLEVKKNAEEKTLSLASSRALKAADAALQLEKRADMYRTRLDESAYAGWDMLWIEERRRVLETWRQEAFEGHSLADDREDQMQQAFDRVSRKIADVDNDGQKNADVDNDSRKIAEVGNDS